MTQKKESGIAAHPRIRRNRRIKQRHLHMHTQYPAIRVGLLPNSHQHRRQHRVITFH